MLHAGLDLSRKRLDYCLLDEWAGRVEVGAAPPDGDGLRGFARGVADRHGHVGVRAAIESMNGARFVHDTLERCAGWEVLSRRSRFATRRRSRAWARWHARPTRSTRGCWPSSRAAIWCRRSGYRDLAKLVIATERHTTLAAPSNLDRQEVAQHVTV